MKYFKLRHLDGSDSLYKLDGELLFFSSRKVWTKSWIFTKDTNFSFYPFTEISEKEAGIFIVKVMMK